MMLVKYTLRTFVQCLTAACREESEEHRAQTVHSLVLQGNMRTEVQCIMYRDKGGVLQPAEQCTKTGGTVMEVLRTKRLEFRPPTSDSLELYPDRPPELVPVDVTNNTVTVVAGLIS